MAGARMLVTRPIRVMPPMITIATMVAVNRPVIHTGIPMIVFIVSATVLAWMALPVRNAVVPNITAKNTASGFHAGPIPRSM